MMRYGLLVALMAFAFGCGGTPPPAPEPAPPPPTAQPAPPAVNPCDAKELNPSDNPDADTPPAQPESSPPGTGGGTSSTPMDR